MYNNKYNKNKYRGVDRERIIYEVISKINWATGPTGFSAVESIIDADGNLSSSIVPYDDSLLNINSSLNSLFTNSITIDKDVVINNIKNHINFPIGTTINNQIPASIHVKGSLPSIVNLPVAGNVSGDAYMITNNLYIFTESGWVNIGAINGEEGITGTNGYFGYTGYKGFTGMTGFTGIRGVTGVLGQTGVIGDYDLISRMPKPVWE